MSTTITLRHTFAIDEASYWDKLFFDPTYSRRLYLEALEFVRFDPSEAVTESDGSRTLRVAMEPKNDAPAVVQKLAGTLAYVEEGGWNATDRVYRFTLTPSKLADKVKMSGSIRVSPRGEREIERIVEVRTEVKLFAVGGVFESFIEKTTRDSWEKNAVFTRAYIAAMTR